MVARVLRRRRPGDRDIYRIEQWTALSPNPPNKPFRHAHSLPDDEQLCSWDLRRNEDQTDRRASGDRIPGS